MFKPSVPKEILLFALFIAIYFFIPFNLFYHLAGITNPLLKHLIQVAVGLLFGNMYVLLLVFIESKDDSTNQKF